MAPALLDTDILSEILKQKDPAVVNKAAAYLQTYQHFAFSALTRYEIVRGLKAKKASRQLQRFATFCQQSIVLAVTDAVLDRAADLWALATQKGLPAKDADLIIAATALEHGRDLITGNMPHFSWIPGLTVQDWRKP